MSYSCRLYINSGFNTENIPDSPTLLDSAAIQHIDCPALQILQSRDLSYVDVKVASYESIKDVDYVRVDTWFYAVPAHGVQMLTVDTARLTLYADYMTSAGGPGALHYLDGITNRVHVASDGYGEWQEADPYMAPSQELELQTIRHNASGGTPNFITVVKSALDLSAMGSATSKEGVTYTDAVTGETVTVPKTQINSGSNDTQYSIGGTTPQTIPSESKTRLFDVDYTTVKNGLREVNDLGINGAVTAQVALPLACVTPTINADGSVASIVGKDEYTTLTSMPYEYTNAKNKKLDYSEHTRFGIMTASGGRAEFLPSQIYVQGLTQPFLRMIADPRTDGRPYFRFSAFNKDASRESFFMNAVPGVPWKQIPLVYEGAQGKALTDLSHSQALDELAFKTDMTTADLVAQRNRSIWETAGQGIGNVVQAGLMGKFAGGEIGAIANIIGQTVGTVSGMTNIAQESDRQYERALAQYEHDRKIEKQKYMVNTNVYTPVVQFPFSSDLFNDLYNNPCIVYRYKYTAFDIARIDKILTMYGYKVTKNIVTTDFTNRKYFNYVEAQVSVGNLPRWWADGIAMQISSGVRVWHVKPNNSRYTDNPIRT